MDQNKSGPLRAMHERLPARSAKIFLAPPWPSTSSVLKRACYSSLLFVGAPLPRKCAPVMNCFPGMTRRNHMSCFYHQPSDAKLLQLRKHLTGKHPDSFYGVVMFQEACLTHIE